MPDWYGVSAIKDAFWRRKVADAHSKLVVQLLEDFFLYSECILPTFQDSLADCLLALFCPRGSCTVMKRFWDHLSSSLHSLLVRGTYPLLNCKMQVVCFCKYLFCKPQFAIFIIQECTGQLIMCCLAASPDLNLQSFELVLSNFEKAENLQVNLYAIC